MEKERRAARTGRGTGAAFAALAVVTALAAGGLTACQETSGPNGGPEPARTEFTDPDQPVEVLEGETFTLVLEENPSTGFVWKTVDPAPDPAVAAPAGDRFESDNPELDGIGGTRYLHFDAVGEGETLIVLQRSRDTEPTGDELTFEVTVGAATG
ncbi:protease inhibitor I42 family protein [Streptomyces profundus]|uniref:protease inhibitor I42 family protein n=1 Tax=Streptomyces profundus TaxID=2867410 RepID=UPI001D161A14|nr:protease inhibitor I42 family protein [Streptomyces sp. MA3_2.13]UED85974.1 protease inhibitor I42 family protein [Streptomyces sp. MA3_2.13]